MPIPSLALVRYGWLFDEQLIVHLHAFRVTAAVAQYERLVQCDKVQIEPCSLVFTGRLVRLLLCARLGAWRAWILLDLVSRRHAQLAKCVCHVCSKAFPSRPPPPHGTLRGYRMETIKHSTGKCQWRCQWLSASTPSHMLSHPLHPMRDILCDSAFAYLVSRSDRSPHGQAIALYQRGSRCVT